ncbi:MAG: hypothetical protein GYB58_07075 [Gammaproteobacteria bacterium]|nr:hypothetical protein [Gammaproteobacteria bacterium]
MTSDALKYPRLYSNFYRNGPSHRDGADVTFNDIKKIFGFRTVTIGNWVTREEQQIAANLFFDALCDLMDILAVPERVLSLNGTLSIAFGKGGQKHCSAHYNARTRTLALAKNAGAGSLAHEWFHAFDHFISPRLFKKATHENFASALWLQSYQTRDHALNVLLENCYQHIFLKPNSDALSDLFNQSVKADRALRSIYYATPQEMCARAFEASIQDNPIKNAFLVQGTKQTMEATIGIYPRGQQRNIISQHFYKYFSALGRALERK